MRIACWVEKERRALERGYAGLRLTDNTFWLEKRDWGDFTNYEATVDGIIKKHRMIALCAYSLDKCGVCEVINVVSNHQFALIKQAGKWHKRVLQRTVQLEAETVRRGRPEEERRAASSYARSLIEVSLDPLVTISPSGKITDVNKATEEATGVSRQELIGSDFSRYFTEPRKAEEGYQTVLSQGCVRD